jgi:hypothetical protein
MQSGVKLSARLIEEVTLTSDRGRYAAMMTLTYRPGVEWQRCHVSSLLDALSKWAARRNFSIPYVWVAELQERGAVHYHVILWLPVRVMIPMPDKRGWWPHGSTKVERARRAVSYITKYASKGDIGTKFPRGLRLWGAGGLCGEGREWRTWLRRPAWLRRSVDRFVRLTRLPGGLLVCEVTGESFRSPYEFVRLERSDGVTHGAWFRERTSGGER